MSTIINMPPGGVLPAGSGESGARFYGTPEDAVSALRPKRPLYILAPEVITRSAKAFATSFPGRALFAVKTNPNPVVLKAVAKGGIYGFDVASLDEIKTVRSVLPRADLYFMHPIKAPEDIRAAYFEYGVRHFVLDHVDELYKIMRETSLAPDLHLFIRVALPKNDKAQIDFSSKFGASRRDAIRLLKRSASVARTLGLSFHVGTQTTEAQRYAKAIAFCADLLRESRVKIDTINVGGGFPVAYEGDRKICSVDECVAAITRALHDHGLSHLELLAEPGRVLAAKGGVLVARVELRKGNLLYLNDGVYGGLFDAADWIGAKYPVKAISSTQPFSKGPKSFRLAGPTCDSLDMMQGPFRLPADIGTGDWIIFENTGAYSAVLRSDFNGFGESDTVCLYSDKRREKR